MRSRPPLRRLRCIERAIIFQDKHLLIVNKPPLPTGCCSARSQTPENFAYIETPSSLAYARKTPRSWCTFGFATPRV